MTNNYYNPGYNTPYYNNNYPSHQPQQSFTQDVKFMEWVEGEVGAKAFQKPMGIPVNAPIPLWDSTGNKIYLKSWNQVGAANPLTEIDYTIKDNPAMMQMLPDGISGKDMSQYVSKQEFDEFKRQLENLSAMMSNTQNSKNRGGSQ